MRENEQEFHERIVAELTDYDAKRHPEWLDSWLRGMLYWYDSIEDKDSPENVKMKLEPFTSWLTTNEEKVLAKILWDDRSKWIEERGSSKPYPYTRLATFLDPFVGTF